MKPTQFQGSLVNSNRILYTPSDFAKTNLLHLQEIGKLRAEKPHTSAREGLNSYLFFVVLDGSGTLNYDGVTYALEANSCVFIDCQKPYSHCSSENLWTLQWVHFYGPNMKAIYQKYQERGGNPTFTTTHTSEYNHTLEELFSCAASVSYVKDMKIYEKLTTLLTLLMEDSWSLEKYNDENPAGKRNLQDLKEYLDIHFAEKITLDFLADSFYINKYYLTRIFKEQFGISINQYLLQLRITHAKQLLRFSTNSIEEIATLCGIPDANYFARTFKKVEGITPGDFRRSW